MSSRNISIRDKVYEELKAEKRPGESFADVIDRLLKSGRPPLSRFSGAISEETADRMENGLEELSKIEKKELADLSEG